MPNPLSIFWSLFLAYLLILAPHAHAGQADAKPGEIVLRLQMSHLKSKSEVSELVSQIADKLQARLNLGRKMGRKMVTHRLVKTPNTLPQKFAVIHVPEEKIDGALKELRSDSRVKYAESNFRYSIRTPNDPDFDKLWGLSNSGQADSSGQAGAAGSDIGVAALWNEGVIGSHRVKVAVIDTGIDRTHPDLADNIWKNPNEIPNDGIDNDQNGFVDDVYGWDFSNGDNDAFDDNRHGTHCAGTIGAVGGNQIAVAGVAWKVSLIPVKFLGKDGGGTLDAAIESIQYATSLGVDIMSNSWGGGSYSEALAESISDAEKKGILFVAAAGNSGQNNDQTDNYPAGYPYANVLSVAATDNQDRLAGFSNYGAQKVHVAAPGVNIFSTVPGGKIESLSGTSMATPHVSGVAALLLSQYPELTYAQLKERLMRTSTPVRLLGRMVAARGRINAYNALHDITPERNEPNESLWVDVKKSVESAHPYAPNLKQEFSISVPGAQYIRIIYEKLDTESGLDIVEVSEKSGLVVERLSGTKQNYVGQYIIGDYAKIRFITDESIQRYGFKIEMIQAVY